MTNADSLTFKGCHVPLTAFYRPVKALIFIAGVFEILGTFFVIFKRFLEKYLKDIQTILRDISGQAYTL